MESRKLAAILSNLISQLLLLLLLLQNNILPHNSLTPPNSTLQLLLLLLFSHHQLITTITTTRKRKRTLDSPTNNQSSPHTLTPDSFRNNFMMTSSSFEWLSGLLEPLLDCRDPAPLNLSSTTRLAIGLSRLAAGEHYPQISSRFSVSLPVAKFCVKQLCRVLCTNFRFWLSFPNPSDLLSVSRNFQTLSTLPNCCGVVFSTRFDLVNSYDDDDDHNNNNNNSNNNNFPSSTSSIAAQIVVDSSFRILTIVAGFQGNKTDSQILKSSTLFNDIEQGTLLNSAFNQYLIGDSKYPLLPWLMVPYVDAVPGSVEANFNSAIEIMRRPALRTAASLRNWGVLRRPVSEEVKMAVAYIGACSILHNGLLMREDFSALASGFEDSGIGDCNVLLHDQPVSEKALELRDALAKQIVDPKSS